MEFRARVLFVLVLFALGGLIARAGWIQLVRGDEFALRAKDMHLTQFEIPAARGRILDRRGRPLAVSYHARSIAVDPIRVDDPAGFATELAFLIGDADAAPALARRLRERKAAGVRFAYLRRHADRDVVARVEAADLPGLDLREEPRREYPHGDAGAAVVGVVGTDPDGRIAGLTGLEARYDEVLRGTPGRCSVLRSGRSERLHLFPEREVHPVPGRDIYTALDVRVQQIAEQALDALQEKHEPKASCAIVMDPYTGELLALAGRPHVRRSAWPNVSPVALKNVAVHNVYELGSTLKPLVVAAALSAGAVRENEDFDCGPGRRYFGGRLLRDVKPNHVIDVETILVKSSNVGVAQVGQRLGIDGMRRFFTSVGFDEPTGVEIAGEESVRLKPRDKWTENYTLVSVSMGRELQLSPLQLARAYAALVNGGFLVRPTLLRRAPDMLPRRVPLRPAARRFVIRAMRRVVEEGTGRRARVNGLAVAGKTGTSEHYPKGSGRYVSSFVGFAPADAPRLLVLVVADSPKSVGGLRPYGGVVAAPLVGAILRRSLPLLDSSSLPNRTLPGTGVRYLQRSNIRQGKVRVAAVNRSSVWAEGMVPSVRNRNPVSVGVPGRRADGPEDCPTPTR